MIYVALPTYDGTRHNAAAFVELSGSGKEVLLAEGSCSLLAHNFNRSWVDALNLRPKVTHFLMLHADIVPSAPFLEPLLEEQARVGADVLSVVVPIKSHEGLTSTALESGDKWKPRRLTMTEVLAKPETWTEPGLLVNTGLLLVDFTRDWVEEVCFTVNDAVRRGRDGKFEAVVESEDWHFSRQVRALGVEPWATRKIRVNHVGSAYYGNATGWGTRSTDPSVGS